MARRKRELSGARAWLRTQNRIASKSARPAVIFGFAGLVAAIGQALCAARLLATGLSTGRVAVGAGVAFGLLALVRAGLGILAERAAFDAGAANRRRLRSEILGKLLAIGPSLLRTRHSGELAATVIDRIEALDGLFARWSPAATLAVAGPVAVLVATVWADPTAALILAVCGLFVPFGMALAGIGAAAASRRQFVALSRLQARFLDRVRGIATIVIYGRADDEARALAAAASELRRRTMRVLRVAFLSSTILDLAAAAALIALAVRYGLALAAHRLDAVAAIFVLLLVPEFFSPLRAFAAAYQDRFNAQGAADELIALPSAPPPATPPAGEVRTVAAQGVTVAFENVRLTWDETRGPALDGLSFRVPAGETLVLAGPSGAGKSTVIEILLGFVRPQSGRVTVNGADIADLVPEAHARLTAWVGQRPVLFAGTIAENIRFARPEATDEEVEDAAAAARVADFAARLPDRLETRIGEGGYGLSGGQAQRIAVARAFLKNAPLLLLDEPTAHLDPSTEAEVLDSLRKLALGRTVILASHSAAAKDFAGRRLDLRDGRAAAVAELRPA